MKLHTVVHNDRQFTIETWYEYPPIPIRAFDYGAHVEGYDGADPPDPIGWGRTEEEAIADLLLNLDLETDEWLSSRSSSLRPAS